MKGIIDISSYRLESEEMGGEAGFGKR